MNGGMEWGAEHTLTPENGTLILKLVALHGQFSIIPDLPLWFRTFYRLSKSLNMWLNSLFPYGTSSLTILHRGGRVTMDCIIGRGFPSNLLIKAFRSNRILFTEITFIESINGMTLTLHGNGALVGIYMYCRHNTPQIEYHHSSLSPIKTEMTFENNVMKIYIIR